MPPTTPNSNNDDVEAARSRARLAMQGETRATKALEEDKELTEKRKVAAFAMEGVERRAKREAKEHELKDKQEMLKRIDDEVKRREDEIAKKKQEAEEARKNQVEAESAELKKKEDDFTESQTAIEKLKAERGSTLKTIHTLQSDIAEAIKTEHLSTEKISIAAQERPKVASSFSNAESQGSGGGVVKLIIMFLVLLLIGGGGFGIYRFWKTNQAVPVNAPVIVQSIIFAETSFEINSSKVSIENLSGQTSTLLASPAGTSEKIVNIYFTKEASSTDGQLATKSLLNFTDWLTYSNSAIPTDFARFIQDYMLGLDKNGSSSSFFLVLKTDSYANVYQTLLDHEDDWVRNIFQNLNGKDLVTQTADQKFSDYILKNLKTRVLRDKDGQTVLIYTFLDLGTFIVAETEDALYHAYTVYNTRVIAN